MLFHHSKSPCQPILPGLKQNQPPQWLVKGWLTGLPDRIRTCDPMIKSHLLYQLSYGESVEKFEGAKIENFRFSRKTNDSASPSDIRPGLVDYRCPAVGILNFAKLNALKFPVEGRGYGAGLAIFAIRIHGMRVAVFDGADG